MAKATIRECVAAALAARGYEKQNDLTRCEVWKGVSQTMYLGVNGSVRFGKTRTASHKLPEGYKNELIAEGRQILKSFE